MAVPIVDDIINWVMEQISSIRASVNGVYSYLSSAVSSLNAQISYVWNYVQSAVDNLSSRISNLYSQVGEMVNTAVQGALSAYTWVLSQAQSFFSGGLSIIQQHISTLFSSVDSLRTSITEWVERRIEDVVRWVTETLNTIAARLDTVFEVLMNPERLFEHLEAVITAVW